MIIFMDKSFSKWILGAIVRETAAKSGFSIGIKEISRFSQSPKGFFNFIRLRIFGMPVNNLIVNQINYYSICKHAKLSKTQRSRARVFYTHSTSGDVPISQISLLNDAAEVIVMNTAQKQTLKSLGVTNPPISICHGAINSDYFFPSNNSPGEIYVFVSGDVKERKQPARILEVIRACPDIEFILFGKKWQEYITWSGEKYKNIKIAGTSIYDSGYYMRSASCYLSLSTNEGGPYGTIEALASGTPVVCTATGWNPEVIDETNGVIVRCDESTADIRAAIEQAFKLKKSAIKPALKHTSFNWKNQAQILFGELSNEA